MPVVRTGGDSIPVYVLRDKVVVSAAKLPISIYDLAAGTSILTHSDIESGTARTLPELLAERAELHVYDLSGNGMNYAVESRGFTALGETSHLRFLVDGVPFGDLSDDNAVWNLFDVDQLDRVEVIRSSSSTLHGNTSFAGVVNLIPRVPKMPRIAWGALERGSDGRGGATLGAGWRAERLAGTGSFNWRRTDGFRQHDSWRGTTSFGTIAVDPDRPTRGRLSVIYHEADADLPGSLPRSEAENHPSLASTPLDGERTRRLYVVGGVTAEPRGADDLHLNVYVQDENEDRRSTVIDTQALDRDATSFGFLGSYRWKTRVGRFPARVLMGLEGSHGSMSSAYSAVDSAGRPGARLASGDIARDEAAGFVRGELVPTPRLTAAAGIRYDSVHGSLDRTDGGEPASNRKTMSAWSPSASLNYRWEETSNVYAQISRSFKTPTLTQLYDVRPYFFGPQAISISNDALDPQDAVQVELGARGRLGDRFQYDVAAYTMKAKNEIGFNADPAAFSYANLGESTHRGVELGVTGRPVSPVVLDAGYTYCRARFDNNFGGSEESVVGNQINNVPRHVVRAGATCRAGRYSVRVAGTSVLDQYADEGNTVRIPDYTVVDLKAGASIAEVEAYLTVSNLFDTAYLPAGYIGPGERGEPVPLFYPGPGREIQLGIRFRLD